MSRLLRLVFGDLRNAASVAVAVIAAFAVSRHVPGAAGGVLAVLLIAAAALQSL